MICMIPVRIVVAKRYCNPCSRTSNTISNAIAPVAALIMPLLPPTNEITKAIQNEAYNPTFGSTPAMILKAIASGISASATTSPERISPLMLPNHSCLNCCVIILLIKLK